MDRKTFFKSTVGIIASLALAKSLPEPEEPTKTEETIAQKMLKGARNIDDLFRKLMFSDENGNYYLRIKRMK